MIFGSMIRFFLFLILTILLSSSFGQDVYQYGDLFGVKYNGVVVHNAKYNKVEKTDYFLAGKDELYWYNLSEKGKSPEKKYKRFLYHLKNELLIVGVTTEGKIDLFNETGDIFYLENGDYDKVKSTFDISFRMYDSELLLVSKNGKKGLYNWVHQKEVLAPLYDDIKIHTDCSNHGKRMLYLRDEKYNLLMNPYGEIVFRFRNTQIDDISDQANCDGYMLKRGNRIGYMRGLKSGKYFLIKPVYDKLFFLEDNGDLIKCLKGSKYGLYYKNKMILPCKYDKIEITDNGYVLGIAIKNLKKLTFDKEGVIVKVESIYYEDEHY